MIKPSDIVKHLKTYLPIFTDKFTENLSITSARTAIGNVLIVDSPGHGKIAGQSLVISGGTTRIWLTDSYLDADGTVLFSTSIDHDLIRPSQALDDQVLTLGGFGNAWDGQHDILGVPDRNTFYACPPSGVTDAPPIDGSQYLAGQVWRGVYQVAVVIDTDTFSMVLDNQPEMPVGEVDGLSIIGGFRIAAAADFNRASSAYSQQNEPYLFVIMTDVDVSKDRHTLNDGVAGMTRADEMLLRLLQTFSTTVFFPTTTEISGAAAQDEAYGDIFRALASALFGYEKDGSQIRYVAVPVGHGPGEYNSAYYTHVYDWQLPDAINYEDGFLIQPDVAFRNIEQTLKLFNDQDMVVNIDLDDGFFGVPPATPSGLTAATVSTSQIDLAWDAHGDNEAGFEIWRSLTSGSGFAKIASTPAGYTAYQDQGLDDTTTYYYQVRAFNSAGTSLFSNEASATTSIAPPIAPSGLSATAISDSRIGLAWVDNSHNEDGFEIWRSLTSTSGFSLLDTVGSGVTSYQDTGLTDDTDYYYVARAYNSGGYSDFSDEAHAKTIISIPAAPTDLSAVSVSDTQIDLAWTDHATTETGYEVWRSPSPGDDYSLLDTIAADSDAYSDTGLPETTTYYYQVRAFNAGGTSAFTNAAAATTEETPPLAPSALIATTISTDQIDLSWTDNAGGAARVEVWRSLTTGSGFSLVHTSVFPGTTSYSDTGLEDGITYYYKVLAFNSGGSSPFSNEAYSTTQLAAPTGLTATTFSHSQIDLAWTDNSIHESGFEIWRSLTSGSGFAEIDTVGEGITAYSDTGLTQNTTYYYLVRAYNPTVSSIFSNESSDTTNVSYDTDAQAYMDALLAAGESLTLGEKEAIDDWFVAGKTDGWWTKITDAWFWTYGAAAPNAVGVKGSTGVFSGGGWTYNATNAVGNGTTDYFRTGVVPSTAGMSPTSISLAYYIEAVSVYGASVACFDNGASTINAYTISQIQTQFYPCDNGGGDRVNGNLTDQIGLNICNMNTTGGEVLQKTTGGLLVAGTRIPPSGLGTAPSINQLYASASNQGGADSLHASMEYSTIMAGVGMTEAERTAYADSTYTLLAALGVSVI